MDGEVRRWFRALRTADFARDASTWWSVYRYATGQTALAEDHEANLLVFDATILAPDTVERDAHIHYARQRINRRRMIRRYPAFYAGMQ